MKRKLQFLTKTLLVAALLGAGSMSAWADDVPTPVYFNDFSSTDGLTIVGEGQFEDDSDTRFGKVYHNNHNVKAERRTNYLLLPSTVFQYSGSSEEITIGFWVNAKNATNFWFSPIFSAYGDAPSDGANSTPVFVAQARGLLQFGFGGNNWCNFLAEQNDKSANAENTFWMDGGDWHYYTITMTTTKAIVYIDGVVFNSWTFDNSTVGQLLSSFFTNRSDLDYVCLGGNQAWNWAGENADLDASFAYDDFAVYDEALSAAQIKQIMANKLPIVSFPATYDFTTWNATNAWPRSNVAPFNAGTIVKGTNVTALQVANTTATAYFDSNTSTDGNQPYVLSDNETMTVSFTAYHGSAGAGNTTIELLNSDGVALVSYTYNSKNSGDNQACVTNVKLGGVTAEGFEAFSGASRYNTTRNAACFNSSTNAYCYQSLVNNNPAVTMTVSKNGLVSFNYAIALMSIDKSYSTVLKTSGDGAVTMDIASIKITDTTNADDRAFGMSGLNITSEVAAKHIVTFAYADTDDNSLSTIKANSYVQVDDATTVESLITDALKETFYNGDNSKRYKYSTYSIPGDVTTITSDATITLNFAAYDKYNYTVSSSLGTEIKSGYVYADEPTIVVPYPKYELSGTDLYEAAKNSGSDYWRKTYTITSDNQAETITYNKSMENIYSYQEGEEIATLTRTERTDYNFHTRCSNGAAGYPANTDANKIITLPAGCYKMYTSIWGNATHSFTFKKGDNELLVLNCNGSINDANVAFTLTESTDITVTASYNASNRGIDYVIFQNVTSVSKAITAAGWSTYCSPYALDLANVTGTLTDAYIVTGGAAGVLSKTSVKDGTVAANTGLLLKGSGEITIPVVASGTDYSASNKLVGVTDSETLDAEGGYVLMTSPSLAFYKNNKDFTLSANSAYLPAGFDGAGAPVFFLFNEGETTGINAIEHGTLNIEHYYNLNGQRVAQPTKGLYIVNGKKVVVK